MVIVSRTSPITLLWLNYTKNVSGKVPLFALAAQNPPKG
jgi:hypothetical protein